MLPVLPISGGVRVQHVVGPLDPCLPEAILVAKKASFDLLGLISVGRLCSLRRAALGVPSLDADLLGAAPVDIAGVPERSKEVIDDSLSASRFALKRRDRRLVSTLRRFARVADRQGNVLFQVPWGPFDVRWRVRPESQPRWPPEQNPEDSDHQCTDCHAREWVSNNSVDGSFSTWFRPARSSLQLLEDPGQLCEVSKPGSIVELHGLTSNESAQAFWESVSRGHLGALDEDGDDASSSTKRCFDLEADEIIWIMQPNPPVPILDLEPPRTYDRQEHLARLEGVLDYFSEINPRFDGINVHKDVVVGESESRDERVIQAPGSGRCIVPPVANEYAQSTLPAAS